MSHFEKEQQLFSGNLPLPKKALSNVICKFLHIHAIVLNLIHRPVLVLTWGNLSHRKKHWASMSRGVAFDVILHFCSGATSETPDVCRPLVEVANKCWHSLRKSGLQIPVSTSFTNCLLKWKSYKKYKTLYQLPQCQYLFLKSTCTLRVFLCI